MSKEKGHNEKEGYSSSFQNYHYKKKGTKELVAVEGKSPSVGLLVSTRSILRKRSFDKYLNSKE